MWKVSAVILLFVFSLVCGIFALPRAVSTMVADELRERTGAQDVQLSITDSPRLIFGEIGALDGVIREGRIGKVFVRELTVTGTNLRFDMGKLLRDQQLILTDAESVEMHGVVDADAIRELVTSEADKFTDVAVTVHPGSVLTTAKTRAFGQTFEVTIEGGFSIVSGDLYYKATHIAARGMGLNVLSLDGLFPDVLVARADTLPFGLAFESIEEKDGVVILTAGK
ncbi:hypothetical protein HMPREF9081_0611 [Centipeda periodontii DSM 2778]|uniref:DUF2993 domain-containing protein n=1 Tax=Centipeda periodontii DSM 2778 TaxID=888060 RepID=F5RK26_9FIRM|nr:hypothetical protein [Centipeda periodontii]EGK61208.1 hypothetical protein HMPREF9081_0611 [Centipeda periodontii DSM 2778]